MDYFFATTPAGFASDLAAQTIPSEVRAAIQSAWDATDQTEPTYQVNAATGTGWTVIRVAAVLEV